MFHVKQKTPRRGAGAGFGGIIKCGYLIFLQAYLLELPMLRWLLALRRKFGGIEMIDYKALARRVWCAMKNGNDEDWYIGFIDALSIVSNIQDIRTDKKDVIFYLDNDIKIVINMEGMK